MIIVPISAKRQREIFTTKSYTFNAKPAGKKRDFPRHHTSRPLPAVLPPVGRCVASQGGGGVRIPLQPIWARVGELFGAPKAKQPAMDLSRDKNAEEMKWSPLEMGAAMQAHGA